MKIATTSDIHSDITPQNRKLLPFLAAQVERLAPDVFVLAGDIANTLRGWEEALFPFKSLELLKLIVPGNHDVWIESKRALRRLEDSEWKHRVALQDIARKNGFHYLVGDPLVVENIGFVGSLGWYDYSLRDPRLDGVYGFDDYDRGEFADCRYHTGIWNDTRNAVWLKHPDSKDWQKRRMARSAADVFEKIFAALEQDIQQIASRISKVVAVVHTNPFPQCIPPKACPDPFDAYEGSVRLGQLLAGFAGQREVLCLCGHRHQPLDITALGVRTMRSPVGYLEDFEGDYAEKAAGTIRLIDL